MSRLLPLRVLLSEVEEDLLDVSEDCEAVEQREGAEVGDLLAVQVQHELVELLRVPDCLRQLLQAGVRKVLAEDNGNFWSNSRQTEAMALTLAIMRARSVRILSVKFSLA